MRRSESVWGQGGLSEREMDMGEGLRWLTEPVYISNGTLLWEGGRGGKSAAQAKHSSTLFSVSFRLRENAFVSHNLETFLPSTFNQKYDAFDIKETVSEFLVLAVDFPETAHSENPDRSTVEPLVLPPLLSIMSLTPWQKAQEESVEIVALTHSEAAREKRLKPSGWGVDGVGVDPVPGRFGAQCNRSTLSIVNHCHPSEATRLALNAANPLRSLCSSRMSVRQGTSSKGLGVWRLRQSGGGGGGGQYGGEEGRKALFV